MIPRCIYLSLLISFLFFCQIDYLSANFSPTKISVNSEIPFLFPNSDIHKWSPLNLSSTEEDRPPIEGTQTFVKQLPQDAPTSYAVGDLVVFELKIACSSLTIGCGEATITDVVPDGLEFVSAGFPVNTSGNYNENTNTFTAISANLDEGDSRIITVAFRISPNATLGGTITNQACSSISTPSNSSNANICSSATIDIANTPLEPDWFVNKTHTGEGVVLDEPTAYRLQICASQASLNVDLLDINIVDNLPAGVIVVDADGGNYNSNNNTISWSLGDLFINDLYGDGNPDANKCKSRNIVIVYPSSIYSNGDVVVNQVIGTGEYSPTGEDFSDNASSTETIASAAPSADLSKTTTNNVEQGESVAYRIHIKNEGNVALLNYKISDIWTHSYLVNSIRTPNDPNYDFILETTTNGGSTWQQYGVYGHDDNIFFAAANQINGVRLTPFSDGNASAPNTLDVGTTMIGDDAMIIRFDIPLDATGSITNCVSDSADNPGYNENTNKCATATITPAVALVPKPFISKKISPDLINPGDQFIVKLERFVDNSQGDCVSNPVVVDLLPAEMEFISFKQFDPGSVNFDAPAPTFEVLQNYNNTGRTLIRFTWSDNPPNGLLNTDGDPATSNPYCFNKANNNQMPFIEFFVGLKPGTPSGTYQNTSCIFAEGQCDENEVDIYDLDGDNNSSETFCDCDNANVTLLGGASMRGQKWVRGAAELGIIDDPASNPAIPDAFCPTTADGFTRFPCIANTFQNDIFDFRLVTINQGTTPLKDIVIYDVFPYPNDTGVSEGLSMTPRLSDWRPLLISVTPDNSLTQSIPYVLEYSTSANPSMPEISETPDESGWQNNPNNNWTTNPPNPIGSARAIRIRIPFSGPNYWVPGDSLIFNIKMQVPSGVNLESTAWNSFAYRSTNADNNSRLFTAEPRKAGIQIPLEGEIACLVSVDEINQSSCNNNLTPTIANDDFFTVNLSASGTNTGSSGKYQVVLNASTNGSGGMVLGERNYGSSITVGNGVNGDEGIFSANGNIYTLTIRDKDDYSCFTTTVTQPVSDCYEDVDCDINVVVSQPNYNNNGTPNNISDDTFTFTLVVNGQGTNGWNDGTQSGNFGETTTYGPYPVDADGASFSVFDETNRACSASVGVNMSSCVYLGNCTCCEPE